MFDIGAFELLIVAVLALVVVGPKELPRMLRTVMQVVRKVKAMSREFTSGLDDLAKEVDINEMVKDADLDPFKDLRDEEGLKPGMTPDEITKKILSNQSKKVSRVATVKTEADEKSDLSEEADKSDDK